MDLVFHIIMAVVLLGAGSAIAIWWWKLARRIAPYRDEISGTRGEQESPGDEVIIVPTIKPRKDTEA